MGIAFVAFMRTFVIVALLACSSPTSEIRPPALPEVPRLRLGTGIEWNDSIEAAALRALNGKLVLALHVSGHFDDVEFT